MVRLDFMDEFTLKLQKLNNKVILNFQTFGSIPLLHGGREWEMKCGNIFSVEDSEQLPEGRRLPYKGIVIHWPGENGNPFPGNILF